MHIINTIIHNGCGYIFTGYTLRPSYLIIWLKKKLKFNRHLHTLKKTTYQLQHLNLNVVYHHFVQYSLNTIDIERMDHLDHFVVVNFQFHPILMIYSHVLYDGSLIVVVPIQSEIDLIINIYWYLIIGKKE